MMGIVVPETCWAYKKYNKRISGIQLPEKILRDFPLRMRRECPRLGHSPLFGIRSDLLPTNRSVAQRQWAVSVNKQKQLK